MKLPLIELKQPKEWLYFNRVQEIETSRDGENLKTGGWHPYTVLDIYEKREQRDKRLRKYARNALRRNVQPTVSHFQDNDNG